MFEKIWISIFRRRGYILSGSERRRQPERLQTCYENHNAVRIETLKFDGILRRRQIFSPPIQLKHNLRQVRSTLLSRAALQNDN